MEAFLLFLIYSLFGCGLEELYNFLLSGEYMSKRTLLKLSLCPVYGIAGLVLLGVNLTENPILLFFNGFFAVSAVELAFFLLSERIYGIRWWDYSAYKFNLFGGICFFYSVIWGVLNIFLALILNPFLVSAVYSVEPGVKLLLGIFSGVYLAADIRDTHRELMKRKRGEKNTISRYFLYIK